MTAALAFCTPGSADQKIVALNFWNEHFANAVVLLKKHTVVPELNK